MADYNFNPDPEWHKYTQKYETMIRRISTKYCVHDDAMREDAQQEARMAVATVRLENIRDYERYKNGELTEAQWEKAVDSYVHNAIRNAVLSYLGSPSRGHWWMGRSKKMQDEDGNTVRVHFPSRYVSIDELAAKAIQVDEAGQFSMAADDYQVENQDEPVEEATKAKYYGTRKWWTPQPEMEE